MSRVFGRRSRVLADASCAAAPVPHCAPSIKPEGRAAVWATSLVARENPLCCHFPLKMLILIITKRVFYRQGTGLSAPSAAYDATARCDVLSAKHTFLLPWNLIDESRQPDGKCRGRTLSVGTPIAAHSTSRTTPCRRRRTASVIISERKSICSSDCSSPFNWPPMRPPAD